MWLGFFKECIVSLIFLGINLLFLSTAFFWSLIPAKFVNTEQTSEIIFLYAKVLLFFIGSNVKTRVEKNNFMKEMTFNIWINRKKHVLSVAVIHIKIFKPAH